MEDADLEAGEDERGGDEDVGAHEGHAAVAVTALGESATGFHLVNDLLHAGASVVVLAAARALGASRFVSVAAALVFAGLEVGVFHSHGALTSQGFIVHAVLGLTAALLAPARFWYALRPTSMWRSAFVGLLVLGLALELLGLSHGDNIDIHGSGTFSG